MEGQPLKGVVDSTTVRYLDFMNSLPVAVFRTTIEGRIVYCNLGYARIFGYDSPKELIGKPVIDLYHDKIDRGLLIEMLLQRGRVTDLPLRFIKLDGSSVWCAVTARAVMDDDGMVIHLDGVVRDIGDRVEDSGTLVDPENLPNPAEEVMVYFDLKGMILGISAGATELFGFGRKDLAGKSFQDLLIPQHRELFLLLLSDILKFGSEEVVLTVKDCHGQERHIRCNALLVKKDDRVQHIKGVLHDITDSLLQRKERVQSEKFQGVLEMAGGVAHRLNQPLTIVTNLLEDIAGKCRNDDMLFDKVKMVQLQMDRMNDLIKKISSIKKYEAMEYVAGIKIVDIDRAS
jgi:PAS domain S-box-containing protein